MTLETILKGVRFLSPKPDASSLRLVTIGLSHFSEKARWALDKSGLEYYEECHCPAMHLSTTLQVLRNVKRVSTWSTNLENDVYFGDLVKQRHDLKGLNRKETTGVPKLVLPASFLREHNVPFPVGGESDEMFVVASGSSGILKFLSDTCPDTLGSLYPVGDLGKQVMALEHLLDVDLGDAATKWCFGNLILSGSAFQSHTELFSSPPSDNLNIKSVDTFLGRLSAQDVPLVEKVIFHLFGKRQLIPLMIQYNGITMQDMWAAHAKIHEIFSMIDTLLPTHTSRGGGSFLLGCSEISSADLAFAALAVPVLLPPQTEPLFGSLRHCDFFSPTDNAPGCSAIAALAKSLRKRYRSAQYALHLYENFRLQHDRPASPISGPVTGGDLLHVADRYGEDSISFVCKENTKFMSTGVSGDTRTEGRRQDVDSEPLYNRYVYARTAQFRRTVAGEGGFSLSRRPGKSMNYRSCDQKYAHV